jgi:hypothetical protein
MRTFLAAMCAIASFAIVTFAPTWASAQATRTFVSGVGDDVNPCSRTAPCKTFAGAIPKTIDGGVINILDSASYGAVTITKGLTIRAEGSEGAVTGFSGGSAIIVNAPDRQVNLVGLNLDGVGVAQTGIRVIAARQVHIEDCRIFGFTAAAGTGVLIAAPAATRVTIRDSTISGNAIGIDVSPAGNQSNTAFLDGVMLDGNTIAHLRADQPQSKIVLRRSTAIGSAVVISNGAELRSFGDNAIGSAKPTKIDKLK